MIYSRINVNLQFRKICHADHQRSPATTADFLNIINNAIDAIGKDGTITIMTH